jgi:hypothetical protein
MARRDDRWSESIVLGSEGFAEQVKIELGLSAQTSRGVGATQGDHFDRENEVLRPNNSVPWQTNLETTEA